MWGAHGAARRPGRTTHHGGLLQRLALQAGGKGGTWAITQVWQQSCDAMLLSHSSQSSSSRECMPASRLAGTAAYLHGPGRHALLRRHALRRRHALLRRQALRRTHWPAHARVLVLQGQSRRAAHAGVLLLRGRHAACGRAGRLALRGEKWQRGLKASALRGMLACWCMHVQAASLQLRCAKRS